jgi:large subunit ribosomal protein L21
MYAIIVDGGRQHRVEPGQELTVDYRDLPKGSAIEFREVLACSDESGLKVGRPKLEGAVVKGEIVDVLRGPKLVIQKLRRRKNSRRKTGHRQLHIKVRINEIETV